MKNTALAAIVYFLVAFSGLIALLRVTGLTAPGTPIETGVWIVWIVILLGVVTYHVYVTQTNENHELTCTRALYACQSTRNSSLFAIAEFLACAATLIMLFLALANQVPMHAALVVLVNLGTFLGTIMYIMLAIPFPLREHTGTVKEA